MNLFLSCGLLVGLQQAAAHSHQLRHDKGIPPLVETLTGTKMQKPTHDQKVMDMISQFRAEVCATMKNDHGEEFASFEECKKFMETACQPGKDMAMDNDKNEI